ncbi:MAG: replicative DNA helicase [Peptoniphilaceae bacterium]|uniref:replicative DNA helicase n=1 Tax=Parvimonas sp. TaxID=1944660 RepID=UPI0025E3CF9B|nr:replicative DNA helicase [Parvimonas sp.]MCI5997648.1 replicative DNA helicase [Parvimonas sp.]MDD7765340.1 replicative DNA helicase [Peptoniphilaceae bacterium]MDY3051259.1 replicative DNA helicase [Parvimonas sp.]
MHKICDLEAEKCVLSIMITDPTKREFAFEKLRREDFFSVWHKDIFSTILELSRNSEKIDPLTITNKMEQFGFDVESNGGISGVVDVMNTVAFSSNMDSYCKIVKDKSDMRNLLYIIDETKNKAYSNEEYNTVLKSIEGKIFDLSQNENRTGLTHIKDSLKELIEILNVRSENKGNITGISTGFIDLDRILLGMQRKDLILLAARPSVGKTALAVNIALNAAQKNAKVAIFSLEMSKTQLVQRMLSSLALINLKQLISGDIENWEDIFEASSIIASKSIYMDDTAGISITELRSKCRRLKADSGLDFIMIDYLQLMTSEGRNENRQQEISTISRNLKALAKELDVPILALSQLSRDSEKSGRKPKLSDLRESGAIEQDADVVILLYREDYQNEEAEIKNQIELIIAKHRNGETGSVNLNFIKECTRFGDLQTDRDSELYGV